MTRRTARSTILTRVLAASTGVCLILAAGCSQMNHPADTGTLGPPVNLRCEYRTNPLGIDITAPRLSWEVNDPRRGAIQTAYQIQVSTDPNMGVVRAEVLSGIQKPPSQDAILRSPFAGVIRISDVDVTKLDWCSGRVSSGQSIHLPYKGKPLASGQRYYWRVRTWDAHGMVSPWSATAWWETALLKPEDWSAKWIIAPRPLDAEPAMTYGDWIWNAEAAGDNKDAFIRRSFSIDAADPVQDARIKVSADDRFVLFINGRQIGESSAWDTARLYDLHEYLKPGNNTLAIHAHNNAGNYGIVFTAKITFQSGKTLDIRSDAACKSSSTDQPNWTSTDFNDKGWQPAVVVAKYGAEPWKQLREMPPPRQALCMRKEFQLKDRPARARVYVTGLGIYELHLNGQKVGQDIFTPGWTHYLKRLQYQTYDVTGMLKQGPNAIGAILGNGWWSGGLGWKGADQYSEGDLRLLAQLVIEYADGTRETIPTDESWQAHPSPITRNTYYHGESYDARLEMPGWDAPGFDAGKWWKTAFLNEPPVQLVAQRDETIQVTQEIPPMQISEPQKGVFLFDFGQNAAGRCRLKLEGAPKGTRIRLRFGEVLDPNGNLYRENYRSAEATDYYICKGTKVEIWEPIFTYRGFRFCEVTGLPKPPAMDTLVDRVLHTATPPAGTFVCSNWLLNRILTNIDWGLRSNIHSVPTDCPQRDERLGWMGDAQAFAHTSCFLRGMAAFYSKWMFDITDSQGPDGATTDVSPAKVVHGAAKPGWGDAIVVIPYTVWRFYGDTRVIEENYKGMAAWVEYMRTHGKDGLYETKGYGDWVPVVGSPSEWIGSAYFFYCSKLMSEMAVAIGKTDDAKKYVEQADAIAKAFNDKHLNKQTNNYLTGTQTCNILPLFFGITPPDRREAVLANLVHDIEVRGNHLSTGFLGTAYLMPLLNQTGWNDLAYRLASQTSYPSWGYMLLSGATTIWERWDTDKEGPQMNSRNHFALGAMGRWFYESVGGINLDAAVPGFKRFVIRPEPVCDLTWAKATYPSMYGEIRSAWQKTENGLQLEVTIPANTTARVHVPVPATAKAFTITESGMSVLGPGSHVPGVRFIEMEANAAALDVAAGHYTFVVERQ
jgi:alpha-L-rhamnosidase